MNNLYNRVPRLGCLRRSELHPGLFAPNLLPGPSPSTVSDLCHFLKAFPAYPCSLSIIFQRHHPINLLYFYLHSKICFPDDLSSTPLSSSKFLPGCSPFLCPACERTVRGAGEGCGFHLPLPASCKPPAACLLLPMLP